MGQLVKFAERAALSRGYRATVAGHSRALAAPMVGATMVCDPQMADRADGLNAGAALLQRRACLYAAQLARQSGQLPADQSNLRAIYSPASGDVHFLSADGYKIATFSISARVLEFDQLALPAPAADPIQPPCAMTAAMSFEPSATAPIARKVRARKPKAAPLAFKTITILGRRGPQSMRVQF